VSPSTGIFCPDKPCRRVNGGGQGSDIQQMVECYFEIIFLKLNQILGILIFIAIFEKK
jgi:hypothetical protein